MEHWTSDFWSWRIFGEDGIHIIAIPIMLAFFGFFLWQFYKFTKESVKEIGVVGTICVWCVIITFVAVFIGGRLLTGYYG